MLNDRQVAELCARLAIPPAGRTLLATIRTTPPSRRAQSGSGNVVVRIASRKMGCVIQAESHKNEGAAVLGWEHDPAVYEFYDQPTALKHLHHGPSGLATTHLKRPDFLLVGKDGIDFVECKTESTLEREAARGASFFVREAPGAWRCPSGEEAAREYGFGYRVRSSAENDWVTLRNLAFLSDYLAEQAPEPTPGELAAVLARFGGAPWVTLRTLIQDRTGRENDTVYAAIATDQLAIDWGGQLVSEPDTCRVYRDKAAATAHRLLEASRTIQPAPAAAAFDLVAGASIVWDAVEYRILNVGESEVFVEDRNGHRQALKREFVLQLVKDGALRGAADCLNERSSRASTILREASPADLSHANARFKALFPSGDDEDGARTFSQRALRKWQRLYTQAAAAYGNGFLGLIPRISRRGNTQPKIDSHVDDVIREHIKTYWADPNGQTKTAVWGKVRDRCRELGLVPPSEKTVLARIRARDQHKDREIREGAKNAYDTEEFVWVIDRSTPKHGERPFDIGHIDHTQVEIQLVGRKFGERTAKPWLTILFDAYTRCVLAFVVTFDPPSYRSCMAVISRCIKEHGRIPKNIVVDSGSDFECIYFETLLAYLDCNKKRRPKTKSRYGSVIERWFGVAQQELIHSLRGNNRLLRNPRSLSATHDPRSRALWTLPEFSDALNGFIADAYHQCEHTTLGVSPAKAMEVGLATTGMRAHRLIPYTEDLQMACLPSTPKGTCRTQPGKGLKIGYVYYSCALLRDPRWQKKDVPVRYDPFDVSRAFAYLGDRWEECRSEFACEFEGHSEREIALITQEIRGKYAATDARRKINAERIARYLRRTDVAESILEQRQRDQEFRKSIGLDDELQSQIKERSRKPSKGKLIPGWSRLKLATYGEFS